MDYEGYEKWKSWSPDGFMLCTALERQYFEGECRDLNFDGMRVLELGFGNGSFLRFAADRGATVTGTELLEQAVLSAQAAGIRVYRPDLADALAESPSQLDMAAAFDVLEHLTLEQISSLFDSLAKLLKVGGHVIARFPNGQSPLGRATQYGDHTHRSVLSVPLLMQLLLGKPWALIRAGNPFPVLGAHSVVKQIGLRARLASRHFIERMVNRIYGIDITLDPNVTMVLRRI